MTQHQPGQFAVVRTNGIVAKAIRWTTKSDFNHVFIYTGAGAIIEANPSGIQSDSLTKYDKHQVEWYPKSLTQTQSEEIVLQARKLKGIGYGLLDLVALFFMTRGFNYDWMWHRLRNDRTLICSQFVALIYARAGILLVPDKLHCQVTPGDLADVCEGKIIPADW